MKSVPSAPSPTPSPRTPSDLRPGFDIVPDDENTASKLVDIGRRIADEEQREAVTERYVDEANAGEETDEALADIDRAEAAADLAEEVGPGSDAIDLEVIPEE